MWEGKNLFSDVTWACGADVSQCRSACSIIILMKPLCRGCCDFPEIPYRSKPLGGQIYPCTTGSPVWQGCGHLQSGSHDLEQEQILVQAWHCGDRSIGSSACSCLRSTLCKSICTRSLALHLRMVCGTFPAQAFELALAECWANAQLDHPIFAMEQDCKGRKWAPFTWAGLSSQSQPIP